MSTKKEVMADPTSCLNKAFDDEPVFVLRAKDPLAMEAVLDWAITAEMLAAHEPEKIAEARRLAEAMRAWRLANDYAR